MAAPNIVNVTSIIGITTALNVGGTGTNVIVLSNAANSNNVFKVNTLLLSNSSSTATVDVTVKIYTQANGAGTGFNIANTVTIPADSSLVVIGKDNPIYLEENRSITVLASSGSSGVNAVCSYEQIS
jgi:hypothetical protein